MACSLLGLALGVSSVWGQQPYERLRPVPQATYQAPPPMPQPAVRGMPAPAAPVNTVRMVPVPAAPVPAAPVTSMRMVQLDDGTMVTFPVEVQPVVGLQPPMPKNGPVIPQPTQDDAEYQIQLTPPGSQRLFRLESEKALQERMRQEALQRPQPERIEFPKYDPLSRQPFAGRAWPQQFEVVEPAYVCYGRLYFEDLNSERYGWDLGFVQPFVSAGKFYLDVAMLPYHMGTDWRRHHECSSGYCLPGDPVPYRLYPPGLSATGAAAQVGTVLALVAIFP